MINQKKIHSQCLSENPKERTQVLEQLKNNFSLLPDKQQAAEDLHRLTTDKDNWVRYKAIEVLGSTFPYVQDKQQAWNDLHRLTNDQDSKVRLKAIEVIGSAFPHLPDKQQAWNDLIKLINNQDSKIRLIATSVLSSVFPHVPDKQQAWGDLHELPIYGYINVENIIDDIVCSAFSHIPDKQQAWNDLHMQTVNGSSYVRKKAAEALCIFFSHIPDKQQAEEDLHRLTLDKESWVRYKAIEALDPSFPYLQDKQQAWNDLNRLTNDQDSKVRLKAISILGSVFPHMPDKQQAWSDLQKLTINEDSDVRAYANHSLGKVSIFKASQAEKEEVYKKELEKAIGFFEKAARESYNWNNPSQFCLPFYRSFHTIIFKKQESKENIDEYLAQAKAAIKGSESKELLFEAVENLANALKEVQNLRKLDLEAKKYELDFYRKYCDRAAELMINTKEKAPSATEVMRKGMPILDRRLKGLLEEIQKKAKIACNESKGTPEGKIACTINREVQKWEIGNQEEMTRYVENIILSLKSKIPNTPENNDIYNLIESLKNEKDLTRQYEILLLIIALIPKANINSDGFIDLFAARAGFIGFIVLELLNYAHPLNSNDHLICLSIITIFFIYALVKYKKYNFIALLKNR